MATNKTIINETAVKQASGTLGAYQDLGATFDAVIDETSGISLEQFFNNYTSFMTNTTFVHTGATKPANTHIGIWIDTSSSNQ